MSLDEYEIKEIDGRQYRVRKNVEIHLSQSAMAEQNRLEKLNEQEMKYRDEPDCQQIPPLSLMEQVDYIFEHAEITQRTTDTTIRINIPQVLHQKIIGKGGCNINPIKEQYHCKITFAPTEDTPDMIKIDGYNEEYVMEAFKQLKVVVSSVFNQIGDTHFLCIPIKSQDLRNQIEKFQKEIAREFRLNEKFLQRPEALHITLKTLSIVLPEQIERAKKLLEEISEKIYSIMNNEKLIIELSGITAMGNARSTRVIYIKIKLNEELLDKIIDEIHSTFEPYLSKKYQSKEVLLHLTIFNTNRLKDGSHTTIDATEIIRKYQGKVFGKCKADTIDLAQMVNRMVGTSYEFLNSIPLP